MQDEIGNYFLDLTLNEAKILDFIHNHLNYKALKTFFETDEKLQFFWSQNRGINFFQFCHNKNMNDDFHEAFFEETRKTSIFNFIMVCQNLKCL